MAWFHHRGRNPHHSQYWVDVSFGEITPCEIPWKYLLEFICDGVAAGKTYSGSKWNQFSPLYYWEVKDKYSIYHKETKKKIEFYYMEIATYGWDEVAKKIRSLGDYYDPSILKFSK